MRRVEIMLEVEQRGEREDESNRLKGHAMRYALRMDQVGGCEEQKPNWQQGGHGELKNMRAGPFVLQRRPREAEQQDVQDCCKGEGRESLAADAVDPLSVHRVEEPYHVPGRNESLALRRRGTIRL